MDDLTNDLRKISRIQLLCTVGVVASFVVGLMSIMDSFDETLNIVLGSLSAVVLLASIIGLWKMSWRTFEIEESFHSRNFELTTTLLEKRPW
jgi:uncharacterized membrane-anchored protein